MRKIVLILGVVAAIAVLAPDVALAHDELTNASPQAGAVTASPGVITLTFSSEVATDTGIIRLSSTDGQQFDFRPTTDGPAKTISFDVDRELSAGSWNVEWRILSSDGHPAAGVYSFTVDTAGTAGTAATGVITTSVKPVESKRGAPLGVLVVLALTLLVGVSAGVLYQRRTK